MKGAGRPHTAQYSLFLTHRFMILSLQICPRRGTPKNSITKARNNENTKDGQNNFRVFLLSCFRNQNYIIIIVGYPNSCPDSKLVKLISLFLYQIIDLEESKNDSVIGNILAGIIDLVLLGFYRAVQACIQNRLKDFPVNRAGFELHFF